MTPVLQNNAEVQVRGVRSHNDGLDYVLELAREAERDGKPRSLAIVGRKKSQLLPIEILLTSNEIPFYAKEDLNVLLGTAFSELGNILEAVAYRTARRPAGDIASSIVSCCNYVGRYPLRRAEQKQLWAEIRRHNPQRIDEGIGVVQAYSGALSGRTDDDTKIHYAVTIARALEFENVARAIEFIGEQFEGLQKHYAKSEDDIFYKDPPFL